MILSGSNPGNSYLPNRQLRKDKYKDKLPMIRYLPNRQLRKAITVCSD